MIKGITENEFKRKIEEKDGDFSNYVFDFPFNFSDYLDQNREINFEISFNSSIFKKNISFAKVSFKKNFDFSECKSEGLIDFYNAKFHENFLSRKSEFFKKVNYSLARFYSDTYFNKSIFHCAVHFKKVRFQKNMFMSKVIFCKKIDFSYAHFSNNYYTSFTSINKDKTSLGKDLAPPFFIFRDIFFPLRTIFNEVNLSRAVFQDSIIDKIIFKDCVFSKKTGRDVFYSEICKYRKIEIKDGLKQLIEGKINTLILPKTNDVEDLNIGDVLEISSINEESSEQFFIVTRFDAKNSGKLKYLLEEVKFKKIYSGFSEVACHKCLGEEEEEKGVVGFRLKIFNEKKHWSVLEDNNRQMKKSLEKTKDWQGSGNFYRGEMYAKTKLLKAKKEEFGYRLVLNIYGIISKFGESTQRIFFMMVSMFVFGTFFLIFARPDFSVFEVTVQNIRFFFPIFGSNADIINALNLKPWEEIVVQAEIIIFYFLWILMAIASRRRFRR